MSMDKRWGETFARLEAVENAVRDMNKVLMFEKQPPEWENVVTKEELMKIKGVGESTADAILELLNR